MTPIALRIQNMDSIINTATFIDPLGYQASRLVMRIAYSVADASVKTLQEVKNLVLPDSLVARDSLLYKMPKDFPDSQRNWIRQETTFQFLEKD